MGKTEIHKNVMYPFQNAPAEFSHRPLICSISECHLMLYCNSFASNENTFLCLVNQSLLHEVIC